MSNILLNPTSDLVFKRIFGDNANKDILITFLNEAIELPDHHKIVDIEYLSTEQTPDTDELKKIILDILCVDQANHRYNIEIQVGNIKNFTKRAVFNLSQLFVRQLKSGKSYGSLKPVFFLAIIDGELFKNTKDYYSLYKLTNVKNKNTFDQLNAIFYELDHFNKSITESKSVLDKFLYFLKNAESMEPAELERLSKDLHVLSKAISIAKKSNWTEEELIMYDNSMKARLDYINDMESSREEGFEQGIEQGKEEGVANALILVLKQKFNIISDKYLKIIEDSSLDAINKLLVKAAISNKIEDVFKN